MCVIVWLQKLPMRLGRMIQVLAKDELLFLCGFQAWVVGVNDFDVILGWGKFVQAHHLKLGYHLLVQYIRLNIFYICIYDEEWKEVVFPWTVQNSTYELHRAANGTCLPEHALTVATVYGVGLQRSAQRFYNFRVHWAEYSQRKWNMVPPTLAV